jgi:hypothetical protein
MSIIAGRTYSNKDSLALEVDIGDRQLVRKRHGVCVVGRVFWVRRSARSSVKLLEVRSAICIVRILLLVRIDAKGRPLTSRRDCRDWRGCSCNVC